MLIFICEKTFEHSLSAAPVYFPVAQVGGSGINRSSAPSKWVIDGGTMSNNPAVWGFTEAFRFGFASNINDIIIISLGTGIYAGGQGVGIHNNAYLEGLIPDNGNWSEIPWMVSDMYDLEGYDTNATLLSVILDAVQRVSACQLKALVTGGLQYYRLEPQIPQNLSAIDNIDPANISALLAVAEDYISNSGDGYKIFTDVITLLKQFC